jgi:hypothetical protein
MELVKKDERVISSLEREGGLLYTLSLGTSHVTFQTVACVYIRPGRVYGSCLFQVGPSTVASMARLKLVLAKDQGIATHLVPGAHIVRIL